MSNPRLATSVAILRVRKEKKKEEEEEEENNEGTDSAT